METKIQLFQVLRKTNDGRLLGVLSDNSLDRDGEIVGEEAFDKVLKSGKTTVRLMMDHKNEVLMRIGDWTNLHKAKKENNVALLGTPKFFLSNPNAQIIKGMLDEGAELDISIGAIVKDHVMIKNKDGSETKKFTDIELLEGSFVGIGSNKNSSGRKDARLKIAKMFEEVEEKTMTEEKPKEDDAVEVPEKEEEESAKSKEMEDNMASIKKEAEEAVAGKTEAEAKTEAAEEEKTKAEEEVKSLKAELEKLKKATVKKAISDSPAGEMSAEAMISKEVSEGALPVIKK